ncbi:MAG: putative sulfate exporter family transporter [Myxococcota bacterium]
MPEQERRAIPGISEDWWSVILGLGLLLAVVVGLVATCPKPSAWYSDPLGAFAGQSASAWAILAVALLGPIAVAAGRAARTVVLGVCVVMGLAALAKLVGAQRSLHELGLGYALWALAMGLLVSNTVGTPKWLLAGARSELLIKLGLVLLGAELLVERIVALGGPGLMVAYLVTPAVILLMWHLGRRVLKMASPSLTIIIACATSVCGVSAAVAIAAAVRARKEELTLAIGMTMIFTVAMMVGMPALCRAMELSDLVGGAWIGGTVDSTGAVVAAGAMLGERAERVAAIVKMIQNTMIGFIAFVVALYWVARIEPEQGGGKRIKPSLATLWERFPKFVLGFVGASLVASFVLTPALGSEGVAAVTKVSKGLRSWLFAMAFVSIGLESSVRKLAAQMTGGKPIVLYGVGQVANIVLTVLAAWLAFGGVLFEVDR